MSKVFCRECGEEMSPNAKACPKCGCPVVTQTTNNVKREAIPKGEKKAPFLLWLFFGNFGGHHFYEGNAGKGILYFLTFGLLGIGTLIDGFKRYKLLALVYLLPAFLGISLIVGMEKLIVVVDNLNSKLEAEEQARIEAMTDEEREAYFERKRFKEEQEKLKEEQAKANRINEKRDVYLSFTGIYSHNFLESKEGDYKDEIRNELKSKFIGMEVYLKQNLRDPKSYEPDRYTVLVEKVPNEPNKVKVSLQIRYRAKNGFGALNLELTEPTTYIITLT